MYEKVFDEIDTPIGGVPSAFILSVWPKVEPILQRVVEPSDGHNLDDVRVELLLSRWQLWIVGDFIGLFITEIQVKPRIKTLFIRYLAGKDIATWHADACMVVEAFAKAHDCARIEAFGRPGWRKFQARHGYAAPYTVYRKNLR